MTPTTQPQVPEGSPMRVLQVIEATLGGTLRYLENIAAATQQSGTQFGLAYGTHRADSRLDPLLKKVQAAGWRTYQVDMRRDVDPIRDFRALLSLRRVIRNFKPDIIHCHSSKGGALGRVASAWGRPTPARLYTPNALAAPLGKKYLLIEKFLARLTDSFIAVSDSEHDELESFGLGKLSAIDVVYPLIDSDYFTPASRAAARAEIGLDDAPLVLGIGRLMPQKDPGSFVEIVRRVHARKPEVQALWLGSGDGEPEFRQQIREADLQSTIRLVPWQHDVRPYIAASDVLLSTSQFESFGYMVAEALSMGIPAVATDITGTCDIMRGDLRAWLYPKRDYAHATELLLRLLADPQAAGDLGRMARQEIIRRFSSEQMRNALLGTYTKYLRRREPRFSSKLDPGLEERVS